MFEEQVVAIEALRGILLRQKRPFLPLAGRIIGSNMVHDSRVSSNVLISAGNARCRCEGVWEECALCWSTSGFATEIKFQYGRRNDRRVDIHEGYRASSRYTTFSLCSALIYILICYNILSVTLHPPWTSLQTTSLRPRVRKTSPRAKR